MTKLPKALSPGEEGFARDCQCYHLTPEREFIFASPRLWRFDYAWPEQKVAVEIEGGIWNNGAHTRGRHFESDARKYNEAALREWLVFRFSTEMVQSGEAIDMIRKALCQSPPENSGSPV